MWDSLSDPCNACTYSNSRNTKMQCDAMVDETFLDKENMGTFTPMKSDELSMYEESTSPLAFHQESPCSHNVIRRPFELHDSVSQDSGYGTSYLGENGKFASYQSPTRTTLSFSSSSMCSMEDEFLDFGDVEPLEQSQPQNNLPQDFSKLISDPLVHKTKPAEKNSPKDLIIRPLFRRALSLQSTNTKVTPNSSRVRTSLFNESRPFKRPDPPSETETSTGIKRSKMFDDDEEEAHVPVARPSLQRAFSATEESIMSAVQRSSSEPDLIGDYSKNFSLPLTRSRHQDLKAITPATLVQLMKGAFKDTITSFQVIDCRYPYEFDGGHISGAVNIFTKDQCKELLAVHQPKINLQHRHILVFHCEFSSERGPNLYRFLRKEDRHRNENAYPSLNYPEIYLLEGGYKKFFEQFSEMCNPIAYKEMLHPAHAEDLRHFRQKSKTWNCDSRQRPQNMRSLKRLGM